MYVRVRPFSRRNEREGNDSGRALGAESWRGLPILQVPEYPDQAKLGAAEETLRAQPPLVFAGEARKLKDNLARVTEGKAFLLQGGDCAESFAELVQITFVIRLKSYCRWRSF